MTLASGCNRSEPTETAQPATTAVVTTSVDPEAGLWDPCTLPDSALAAAGLNTSTKEKDVAGVKFEGWKVCAWDDAAKTYALTVFTSTHTIDEVRARTDWTDFTAVQIGGYSGLQYRPAGSAHDAECSISLTVGRQLVDFSVLNRHSARNIAKDACQESRRLTEVLIQNVPTS
ncbi:DUF3558 domain-containing protein [Nocardia sp. IBHARD005]|uniref:DUF3558 domain-containing protein n=1 Tax=Nocardia sp. IBHARD005 TaxID=3457765 RepID=UPI0040595ABF